MTKKQQKQKLVLDDEFALLQTNNDDKPSLLVEEYAKLGTDEGICKLGTDEGICKLGTDEGISRFIERKENNNND